MSPEELRRLRRAWHNMWMWVYGENADGSESVFRLMVAIVWSAAMILGLVGLITAAVDGGADHDWPFWKMLPYVLLIALIMPAYGALTVGVKRLNNAVWSARQVKSPKRKRVDP